MGKYMKKSKIAGDVAVMEVSPQSSLGVRTRAKTLALQRLQKTTSSSSPTCSPQPDASSFAYLQLRNRRLEKQRPPEQPKKCCRVSAKVNCCDGIVNSRLRESVVKPVVSIIDKKEGPFCGEIAKGSEAEENFDVGIEGSFGENFSEFESRDSLNRSTRESTPSSLIRDSDSIHTPGSTTRQRTSTFTSQTIHEHMQRNIPTAYEMEEFFANAEKQQQRMFMENYNFDVVNDVPLPGRYEWVQVLH